VKGPRYSREERRVIVLRTPVRDWKHRIIAHDLFVLRYFQRIPMNLLAT
jgi:hypothetical protein